MTVSKEYDNVMIPTYIINLARRPERLNHVLTQFEGRQEFDVKVVEAYEHKVGAIGLWRSILKVINLAMQNEDEVIIICEDDHEFTEHYTKDYLLHNIIQAHEQGCAILSGGIGSFGHAVPLTANRLWINPFQSTQFIVLYKNVFEKILAYRFKKSDAADLVLAKITSQKMVLFPFISRQKDFGYSDVTVQHDNLPGLVQMMFSRTEKRLVKIQEAYLKYHTKNGNY